jgi:hypothetical protein
MRGLRSRLGWSLFIDPPAAPPTVNRGCPERGANRASTDVATIVQGSSSLVRAGTGSQPAGGIPRMNRRTPRPSCTNRASTDVANDVRKCNQPDFCRCGRGAVLADLCWGGRDDQEQRLPLTTLPATETLIKIFPDGANWASTSVAWTSERSGDQIHINSPFASG